MRYIALLLILFATYFLSSPAEATCTSPPSISFLGTHIVYTGDCTDDNEILFTTGVMTNYDACFLMSTTGAVDVEVSLDGTNFNTAAPLSLNDYGATTSDPVIVTSALRMFGFPAKFTAIRIRQNGATDAAASLLCFSY